MATHSMFDGRLQIYKRVGPQRFRSTTKEESLERAKDVAEEWHLDLRGRLHNGEIVEKEKPFARRPRTMSGSPAF